MADVEKQTLNKGYYGPSIPPKSRSYHSHGRGSGCGCCCCLLGFLLKLIVTVVIIVGIAVLLFWLIVRPNKVKFHVVDASLTEFNLTSDNILQYNLTVNMTVRNPNKRIGIYFDRIEAQAYYEDALFDSVELERYYQGHKSTHTLNPEFTGENSVSLGASELSNFNSEKASGTYSIDVKLRLRIRFKLGILKIGTFKPKVTCDLKVPLDSDGTSSGTFQTTKCDVDF